MSEIEDGTPSRSKFWIWFLVVILVVLLMVPVLSVGLALKKTGWAPVAPPVAHSSSSVISTPATESGNSLQKDSLTALREKIEKVLERAKTNDLHPKLEQVQIQASAPSISKTADSIHAVLRDNNYQFVEAINGDSIKIVVILLSCKWPDLSSKLQSAAEKDGCMYRGPSQTSTSGSGADSVVAEIEILRKLPTDSKSRRY
jgi:hypothetical protein